MKQNTPNPGLSRIFPPLFPGKARRAFSLIELLLSITVLSVLLLMVMSLLEATQRTWSTAKTRVTQFRDARVAFESVTRNLSRATLNTYLDYYTESNVRVDPTYENNFDPDNRATQPDHYDRYSKLHFLVDYAEDIIVSTVPTTTHALFFQAPLGETSTESFRILGNLLNSRGYFVAYTSDDLQRPSFLTASTDPKYRYRLMEFRPPSERNTIYDTPDDFTDWFGTDKDEVLANSRVIADNVIALIISPLNSADTANTDRFKIAPNYKYSTQQGQTGTSAALQAKQRHQLPPLVKVTMIAIDEESASRLDLDATDPASKFFPGGTLFTDAAKFDDDLAELESFLAKTGAHEGSGLSINYRVFSGTVSIRGAKWSDEDLIVPNQKS